MKEIEHCIEGKLFMRPFINNDAYFVVCTKHPVYGYDCWLTWRASFTNKFYIARCANDNLTNGR